MTRGRQDYHHITLCTQYPYRRAIKPWHCFVDGIAEIFLRITIPVINSPSPPFARSPLSSSSVRESQVSTLWILHAILWLQQRNIDDTTSDRHLSGPMVLFPYSLLFVLPPTLSAQLLSLEPLWGSRADSLPPTPFATGCVIDCSYCLCTCLWNWYCSFQIKLQSHYKQEFILEIQSLTLLIRGQ